MAENRMELFIETLTGTAFELSCSPLETIVSIKSKIQYSEGIPVSQQHLIWKSQELNDDLCLQDYSISDGATLKLVLGMRGGPINTRQVSETKKFKDLADYVERRSETSGSGGRPFTVLVFHDGDKVHMYTLMEKGDCSVSPLSGTISETSSIASIKHVEELDQELMKENEITREKIAQLQKQIRSLNINKSKKSPMMSVKGFNSNIPSEVINNEFHLPPLQRVDSINSQCSQYLHKSDVKNKRSVEKHCARFSQNIRNKNLIDLGQKSFDENIEKDTKCIEKSIIEKNEALNSMLNSISTTPDNNASQKSQSCSNFLPLIEPVDDIAVKKAASNPHAQTAQFVGVSLSTSCVNSLTKRDPSRRKKAHKYLPFTSSQALSCQRFYALEQWIQNRPKTTPEQATSKTICGLENACRNKPVAERQKRKIKQTFKNPLSVSLAASEKSSLMVEALSSDVSYVSPSITCKSKPYYTPSSKSGIEALVANLKALRSRSPSDAEIQENTILKLKTSRNSPKNVEERPSSGRKLPFIKTKKKSYKRCSHCSKKTGLATSYTCRCGKNFCATHRYAEVHHCSYDYKTEGRRLLQLNNPVVAASKLPKI